MAWYRCKNCNNDKCVEKAVTNNGVSRSTQTCNKCGHIQMTGYLNLFKLTDVVQHKLKLTHFVKTVQGLHTVEAFNSKNHKVYYELRFGDSISTWNIVFDYDMDNYHGVGLDFTPDSEFEFFKDFLLLGYIYNDNDDTLCDYHTKFDLRFQLEDMSEDRFSLKDEFFNNKIKPRLLDILNVWETEDKDVKD